MAEKVITISLKYENGEHFRMIATGGDGTEPLVVCHIQENGNIAESWPDVEKICDSYFKAKLKEVGDEMKKPQPAPPPEGG